MRKVKKKRTYISRARENVAGMAQPVLAGGLSQGSEVDVKAIASPAATVASLRINPLEGPMAFSFGSEDCNCPVLVERISPQAAGRSKFQTKEGSWAMVAVVRPAM